MSDMRINRRHLRSDKLQKFKIGAVIRSNSTSAFFMRGYYLVLGYNEEVVGRWAYRVYSLKKQRFEIFAAWIVNSYFVEEV